MAVTRSLTFLVFYDLDDFVNTGQAFYRMPLNLDSSDVFLMIRLGLCVLGRNTTEVYCHFHYII